MTKTSESSSNSQPAPAPVEARGTGLSTWVVSYTVVKVQTERVMARSFADAEAVFLNAMEPDSRSDVEIVAIARDRS